MITEVFDEVMLNRASLNQKVLRFSYTEKFRGPWLGMSLFGRKSLGIR